MKRLIEYFLNNSLVVNLITFIIILVGALAVATLQKETFPDISFDVITVTTPYPGSSSEDVEKLVSIPLEREIKGIDGIKNLNVMSAEGSSIIYIQLNAEADSKVVLDDVRTAVDNVEDFPEEALTPVVSEQKRSNRGIVLIPVSGDDEQEVKFAAKMLRNELERIAEIARIDFGGHREDQVRVEIDPKKLNDYHLTIGEVAQAVQGRNLNLSAGKIETSSSEIILRTTAEFKNAEDVANVVVRSNSSGNKVLVKDVAHVERKIPEGTVLERSNGKRAVFLDVKMRSSADIITTIDKVKAKTKRFFELDKFKDLNYTYTNDESYYVKRRLGILKNNGLFGITFVFLCLVFFLNFRTAVLTTLGAPLAFGVAFAFMLFLDLSINLISMFGLIMVLGMLVDDAIIVAEHFYHHVENGMDKYSAAKKAALDTVKPVSATIITTIIAFSSIFFMGGIMGKFLWPVPTIVTLCLIASWLECFFILPNHLSDFGQAPRKNEAKTVWYRPLLNKYKSTLKMAMKLPFIICLLFITLFGLSVSAIAFGVIDTELFPSDDVRTLVINLKGKVGVPLDKTDQAVAKLDDWVRKNLKKNELDQTRVWVGRSFSERGRRTGSHYGSILAYLTAPDIRERDTNVISNEIEAAAAKILATHKVTVRKIRQGPPKGKDVDIELYADKIEDLKKASQYVLAELKKIKGIISPEIDFEEGKEQIVAKVDDAEARRLGLTTQQIAFEFRRALAGDDITEIRESDEDIDVVVILNKEARSKVESLKNLYVLNNSNRRISLKKVVKFVEEKGAFVIRRKDGKRVFSVEATLDRKKLSPVKLAKILDPKMKELQKQMPMLSFKYGGENEDTEESMNNLKTAMILSFVGIFFVLILIFNSLVQPLLIMSAIPLSLIGVVITFLLMGKKLGFMAFLGMVGLIGVVVNDSIVLINFINKKIKESPDNPLVDNILEASMSRFRAVLLTSVTTVAGLLPIALAKGGDPFLKPMALSFAGGLAFGTAVTLVFIPCMYLVYMKVTIRFERSWFYSRASILNERMKGTVGN